MHLGGGSPLPPCSVPMRRRTTSRPRRCAPTATRSSSPRARRPPWRARRARAADPDALSAGRAARGWSRPATSMTPPNASSAHREPAALQPSESESAAALVSELITARRATSRARRPHASPRVRGRNRRPLTGPLADRARSSGIRGTRADRCQHWIDHGSPPFESQPESLAWRRARLAAMGSAPHLTPGKSGPAPAGPRGVGPAYVVVPPTQAAANVRPPVVGHKWATRTCPTAIGRCRGKWPTGRRRACRHEKAPRSGASPKCAEEDSNLHPVIPDRALNLARRPIPPAARAGVAEYSPGPRAVASLRYHGPREVEMDDRHEEPRRSASAEAAALRRTELEPEPEEPGGPGDSESSTPEERGGRPSASAEAAALRWRDEHPDE